MAVSYRAYYLQFFAIMLALYGLLSAYIEFFPMYFASHDYPLVKYQIDHNDQPRAQVNTVIVLGDSQSIAGIIPTELSLPTEILSIAGATPIEAYYSLKKYLAHNPKPATLLISFHAMSLEGANFFWPTTAKFGFLNAAEINEVFTLQRRFNDPLFGDYPHLRYWGYRLNFPFFYLAELRNSLLILRKNANEAIYAAIHANRGHYLIGSNEASHDLNTMALRSQTTVFQPSPLLDHYLHRLLDLAQHEQIKVIWYTGSFNQSSYTRTRPDYIAAYEDYMQALLKNYANILFYQPLHALPDEFFHDAHHSNQRGAEFITQDIERLLSGAAQ